MSGRALLYIRNKECFFQCVSYFKILKRIHTDQGTQFESYLMAELCTLWNVDKSRTTPYHPQANGVVERGNRDLGDTLRTLLLDVSDDEWDLLLPQVRRGIRASPHSFTEETPNFLMLGREVCLPEQLVYGPEASEKFLREEYAIQLQDRMEKAYELLTDKQLQLRTLDTQESPSFQVGGSVWLRTKRFSKGKAQKLQSVYSGPYTILAIGENPTYWL